jgi:predicted HAD superfamily phosphohydrolase YqeG
LNICQIDLDKLVDKGVKGIITDLDNTLVGWDVKEPTERVNQPTSVLSKSVIIPLTPLSTNLSKSI